MLIRRFSKLTLLIGPLVIAGYLLFTYLTDDIEVAKADRWLSVFNPPSNVASPGRDSSVSPAHHDTGDNEDSDDSDDRFSSDRPPSAVDILSADDTSSADESPSADDTLAAAADVAPFTDDASSADDAPPADTAKAGAIDGIPAIPIPETLPPVSPHDEQVLDISGHREIFSASTADRKYFSIDFGPSFTTLNPNILPHPHAPETWIVVAQSVREDHRNGPFEELACNAQFRQDGTLACTTPPFVLPVEPTLGNNCHGDLSHFSLSRGPHDMRLFFGPDFPLTIFGSQSDYTCFGMITQDFRSLVDEYGLESLDANPFTVGTEIQRPPPWGDIEKNWFLFWDGQGAAYAHYDVSPHRAFAKLENDGSVGPDLAQSISSSDDACMSRYLPEVGPEFESIHQATNSLSITLCTRDDPTCHPTDDNTFIITIIQWKSYHSWHAVYEPYVMLMQQNLPFALHAISKKPIWIHGRDVLTKDSATRWASDDIQVPDGHTEMFYVTSINWKAHGQKYHGYIDDVLFLNFGIEDARTGAIDVVAGDLLQDLGYCLEILDNVDNADKGLRN